MFLYFLTLVATNIYLIVSAPLFPKQLFFPSNDFQSTVRLKFTKNAKLFSSKQGKNIVEILISDITEKFNNVFINQTINIKNTSNTSSRSFYSEVDVENHQAFKLFQSLLESPSRSWKTVFRKDGITVERKSVSAGKFVSKLDAEKGSKHACVRTIGILNCTSDKIFHLFQANELVPRYNDHVRQLKDIYVYNRANQNQWTKITWSSGPNYGPLKARDFVSIVNYRQYGNGTYIILNRPAYHLDYPPTNKFVRATVLLAGNLIEPYGVNKQQTKLTQIAQINPGGGADTPAIAWMINKLCAVGPPQFLRKLENIAISVNLNNKRKLEVNN